MLEVIHDRKKMSVCQNRLRSRLRQYRHKDVRISLGDRTGRGPAHVLWFSDLGFWATLDSRWNAFGLQPNEPRSGTQLFAEVQINFPLKRGQRRTGADFAEDEAGQVFVLHNGLIGGGRKGIGKTLFRKSFRGTWVTVRRRDKEYQAALITTLSAPHLGQHIAHFVSEVSRIKASVPTAAGGFQPEFSGKKEYLMEGRVEAACDHGLVVNALASKITRAGLTPQNDVNRDLIALDSRRKIKALFEVKTDTSPQSIYSAIGQLYFHGVGPSPRPQLVMVLPEKPRGKTATRLNALGLRVLVYKWSGPKVTIPGLSAIL